MGKRFSGANAEARAGGAAAPLRPRKLRIDACTACQLRCPACPTGVGRTRERLGSGYLRPEAFAALLDENPFVAGVELSNWGEIFLNPELPAILEHARRRRVRVHADVGVNLNAASEDALESVVRTGVRSMTCSIDGASQETYAAYRRGGDLANVLESVRALNRLKARHGTRFPLLKWQFVVFGHNEHEIPRARRLARELGMRFWLKLPWDDLYGTGPGVPPRGGAGARNEPGLGVAGRGEFEARYGEGYAQKLTCAVLWHEPQINWDGRLLGCCVNNWGDFGNAFSDRLVPLLDGPRVAHARGMLRGRLEAREDVPCSACPQYRSMRARGDWLTAGDLRVAGFLLRHRVGLQDDRLRFSLRPLLAFRKALRGQARVRS